MSFFRRKSRFDLEREIRELIRSSNNNPDDITLQEIQRLQEQLRLCLHCYEGADCDWYRGLLFWTPGDDPDRTI